MRKIWRAAGNASILVEITSEITASKFKEILVVDMGLIKLESNASRKKICPTCGGELRYAEGGTVTIVNGKVDMDATLPRHICDKCGVFYRELLNSGFYNVFDLPESERMKTEHRKISTGDIPPTKLKREADGKCECPRCGDRMDFVEAGPVQIVDGKPDFSNTMDHFVCPYCKSVFRKIVGTDFFQWSEK